MTRTSSRRALFVAATTAVLAVALITTACRTASPSASDAMMEKKTPEAMMTDKTPEAMMDKTADAMMKKELPNQLVSPHFVSSSPGHGQTLKQAPETVAINFDFNLNDRSALAVTRDGMTIPVTATTISANKLMMRSNLGLNIGDGTYLVAYKACWPDGSCHDGQFAFQVDSKQ